MKASTLLLVPNSFLLLLVRHLLLLAWHLFLVASCGASFLLSAFSKIRVFEIESNTVRAPAAEAEPGALDGFGARTHRGVLEDEDLFRG